MSPPGLQPYASLVNVADETWRDQAACIGADTQPVFFPGTDSGMAGSRRQVTIEAEQLCGGCPAKAECLEHALAYPERYGTWGGLNAKQRERVRRQRRDERRRTA